MAKAYLAMKWRKQLNHFPEPHPTSNPTLPFAAHLSKHPSSRVCNIGPLHIHDKYSRCRPKDPQEDGVFSDSRIRKARSVRSDRRLLTPPPPIHQVIMARIAMTLLLATCVAAAGATAVPQQAKQGLPVLPRRGGFKKAVQPKVCMFSQRLLMVAWSRRKAPAREHRRRRGLCCRHRFLCVMMCRSSRSLPPRRRTLLLCLRVARPSSGECDGGGVPRSAGADWGGVTPT